MREVKMPSGATLKITPAPFSESKALYQALLREVKGIPINKDMPMVELYKSLYTSAFSSAEVEKALWPCMSRCLYNDLKVTPDTFEPVEARQDYEQVCIEVAKENAGPFANRLYAELKLSL